MEGPDDALLALEAPPREGGREGWCRVAREERRPARTGIGTDGRCVCDAYAPLRWGMERRRCVGGWNGGRRHVVFRAAALLGWNGAAVDVGSRGGCVCVCCVTSCHVVCFCAAPIGHAAARRALARAADVGDGAQDRRGGVGTDEMRAVERRGGRMRRSGSSDAVWRVETEWNLPSYSPLRT